MSEFNLDDKIEDWDKRECVKFCLFCCYKVKHLLDDDSLEALELVEKWLEDESSISEKELEKAAYNANTIVYATSCAVCVNAYRIADAAYYTDTAAYWTAYILNSSEEALYLEYMRDKLSDIMEG